LEFKFVKNVSLIHHLQVFFYNLIKNNRIDKLEKMYIINFYEGFKFKINISNKDKINTFNILLKLSKILNTKLKNLYIMYDLETTGLIDDEKNIYPEIIDRYFYEINLNCVIDEGLVKTTNKLPEIIIKLTNINDDMLDKEGIKQEDFYSNFIELNSNFEEPTYLAHNGNHFDHKIMCHYELLSYDKVKFLDTRQIIINFTKNYEKEVKGKLTEMYKVIMDKEPVVAHRAEADVKLVIDILNKLDIKTKMKLF
jgi:DNA polymerase III epsilon subunit-like protein